MVHLTHTDTDKVPPSASGLRKALLFVRAYPYQTSLASLTALVALQMWLAHARLLPVGIEWALGWLLFLSVVAWSVTTCLLGTTAPVRWTPPWYVTTLLLVAGSILFVWDAYRVVYILHLPGVRDPYLDGWLGTGRFALTAVVLWLGTSALAALVTVRVRLKKSYAVLVVYPLMTME